jgi:hypothetical protein
MLYQLSYGHQVFTVLFLCGFGLHAEFSSPYPLSKALGYVWVTERVTGKREELLGLFSPRG